MSRPEEAVYFFETLEETVTGNSDLYWPIWEQFTARKWWPDVAA